jgi:hypothetical protein
MEYPALQWLSLWGFFVIILGVFFGSIGVCTQGLELARQMLFSLSHVTSPFLL